MNMAMQNFNVSCEGTPLQDNPAVINQQVIVSMPDGPTDDGIVCSTFNLHFCNPCCLGSAAFYYSVKARDNRIRGQFGAAQAYGSTARCLNIVSVIVYAAMFIVGVSVILIYMSALLGMLSQMIRS